MKRHIVWFILVQFSFIFVAKEKKQNRRKHINTKKNYFNKWQGGCEGSSSLQPIYS